MIQRLLSKHVEKNAFKDKAIVIIGPRQVGKTTLLQEYLKGKDALSLNGDDPDIRSLLNGIGISKLRAIIGDFKYVLIDEAQRVNEIGIIAKLITDNFQDVQLFLSGSSALEINNLTQEPLTGRKYEYHLFPISWEEFEKHVGYIEANSQLDERLIYGMSQATDI
jgi:predicted AAA+ superfamily ATPase